MRSNLRTRSRRVVYLLKGNGQRTKLPIIMTQTKRNVLKAKI